MQNGEESRYEVRARVPQNTVQVKKRQCQMLSEISAQKPFSETFSFSIPFTQASFSSPFQIKVEIAQAQASFAETFSSPFQVEIAKAPLAETFQIKIAQASLAETPL